jgi:hypothetical protein
MGKQIGQSVNYATRTSSWLALNFQPLTHNFFGTIIAPGVYLPRLLRRTLDGRVVPRMIDWKPYCFSER